jgi:hypothetical protein
MTTQARLFAAFVAISPVAGMLLGASGCGAFGSSSDPVKVEEDAALPVEDASIDVVVGSADVPKGPYGDLYPTKNLGFTPRSISADGNRIPNLAFTGLASGVLGVMRPTPIHMADLFEPNFQDHDIIAIVLCARWGSSQMAMDFKAAPLARVALVWALGEGLQPKMAATLDDLGLFRLDTGNTPWTVLDPSFTNTKSFYASATLPTIAVLDARTMEIVSVKSGPPTLTYPKDIEALHQTIKSQPPRP